VFYEQKEAAKKLLPETEHWRIVRFELDRREPFVENFWGDDREPTILHDLETTIIDWTHEREWRSPQDFRFRLLDDFKLNNHLSFIFPDIKTYRYFLEAVKKHNSLIDEAPGFIDLAFEDFKPNDESYEENYHIITLDHLSE